MTTPQSIKILVVVAAVGIGMLAMAAGPSLRAHAADEAGKPRYTMTPAEGGGVLRLDTETGAMSVCTGKEGDWSCKPMPESEAATKKRLEDLEAENRRLKDANANLAAKPSPPPIAPPPAAGQPLGEPPKGDTIPPTHEEGSKVPTEEDVDKLFDYVEGMVKKFKERIERLEKEAKKDPPTSL